MSFEEMVVAIIGIVGGISLVGFIIARITGLIQAWINRKKGGYDEETFNRLAKAFMQHKKEMEKRMEHVETIVSEDEELKIPPQIDESRDRNSLSNDLRQKDKA